MKRTVAKFYSFVLVLMTVLTLTACGGKKTGVKAAGKDGIRSESPEAEGEGESLVEIASVLPEDAFDLVYSASAFHWVPEEIGYPKVFQILKSGGSFARFANHPYQAKDNPELLADIQQAYAEYYYPYYGKQPRTPSEYTEDQAAARAKVADQYGFTDTRYALFYRQRILTAAEYRALIGTYSDHITIEESIREPFFNAIEETINRHGGSITIFDTIDLQLARKP